MKKLIFILFVICNIIAINKKNIQAQGFTIDTTVTTVSGINLNSTVFAEFRIISGFGVDTSLTFEFSFYADSIASTNGSAPIAVKDKTWVYFGHEVKSYTLSEYQALDFAAIRNDAKGILENHFGENIK